MGHDPRIRRTFGKGAHVAAMHSARAHGEQPVERLPQHVGFVPLKDLFGTAIEAHDAEAVIERDDRVGGNVDDRGKRRVGMRIGHTRPS